MSTDIVMYKVESGYYIYNYSNIVLSSTPL